MVSVRMADDRDAHHRQEQAYRSEKSRFLARLRRAGRNIGEKVVLVIGFVILGAGLLFLFGRIGGGMTRAIDRSTLKAANAAQSA
jgi:hypothetical protein